MISLEVCANSLTSALAAQEGGAIRVELCENLNEGGTTPSYGQILMARKLLKIKLYPLIRPREGDFLYSDIEFEVMKADIELIISRRDQLWAEAYRAYLADEEWWLDAEQEALARVQVSQREKGDIWDEVLEAKLEKERSEGRPVNNLSLGAALQLIGVPNERMDGRAEERVAACLRRIGFKSTPRKERDENGERRSVRVWVRKSDAAS